MGRAEVAAAIAREGLEAADAVVLRWAVARCGDEPGCADRPLARWLQLEPDNAVPWLLLARRSPGRADEALQALRAATRFQVHWGQLPATVLEALPPERLPYLDLSLFVEAIGVQAALPDDSFMTLLERCRPPPAAGSERQRDCDAWAELLAGKADTLLARFIGLRLGAQAGWPPARVAAQKEALNALTASVNSPLAGSNPLSCASIEALRDQVRLVAEHGEVQALRLRAAAASAPK